MRQNLLDTHTLLWFIGGNKELSPAARECIEANKALNFVSIASLWEIAIKISLRKLELKVPFSRMTQQLVENGFEMLPVEFEDTLVLSSLPFYHRDPFDRMIVAQAINNKLTIITKDEQFASYGAAVLW